jgi:hypothetical protein
MSFPRIALRPADPLNPASALHLVKPIALFVAALLAALSGTVRAAAPTVEAGRSVLELPPRAGNPRNSEGAFAELGDGRILFVYSHFVGESGSDHAKARLAARVSADGGETWAEHAFVATPREEEAMNVMSVSLQRLGNGDLGLFYLLRFSWHEMRMWLRRSADDGRTWGEPINCMAAGAARDSRGAASGSRGSQRGLGGRLEGGRDVFSLGRRRPQLARVGGLCHAAGDAHAQRTAGAGRGGVARSSPLGLGADGFGPAVRDVFRGWRRDLDAARAIAVHLAELTAVTEAGARHGASPRDLESGAGL